jgi:hypothetical protein
MTTKQQLVASGASATVMMKQLPEESNATTVAREAQDPALRAAMVGFVHDPINAAGPVDVNEYRKQVKIQAELVKQGDLSRPEEILSAQAGTLDMLFNILADKALRNINGGYRDAGDTYLRMAMKAQAQCRTTIEAIGEIKYPKSPTFIRQQNIAAQQQVNNYPAGEKIVESGSNELMEVPNGEWMDTGTAGKAIGHDPQLATLATIDGAGNRRGTRAKQHECVEARRPVGRDA